MGIFKRGFWLKSARRYKIRITTEGGEACYWHKNGRLHLVEEDVARAFVDKFKPQLFEVLPDGSFTTPQPGLTRRVIRLEMEEA